MKTKYTPVSCAFHDYLEHFATLRKPVNLTYLEDFEKTLNRKAILTDFSSTRDEDGVLNEFAHVLFETEQKIIRMDQIVAVNDIQANSFSRNYC